MSRTEDNFPSPRGRKRNGRPVWEPPTFDYSRHIGEEYEKQREAILKYYGGNVAKTTEFLDVSVEWRLLMKHRRWVDEEADFAMNESDSERERFFDGLYVELCKDYIEVEAEFECLGTELFREDDGSYTVCKMPSVEESMPGMAKMGRPMEMDRVHDEEESDVSYSPAEGDSDNVPVDEARLNEEAALGTHLRMRGQGDEEELQELAWLEITDTR